MRCVLTGQAAAAEEGQLLVEGGQAEGVPHRAPALPLQDVEQAGAGRVLAAQAVVQRGAGRAHVQEAFGDGLESCRTS